MAVYVFSDPHFEHNNILKVRNQFASIDEHDAFIVERILSTCGKRDSLHILGDVCMGKDSLRYLEEISKRVEHLHICLGNHDLERTGAPRLADLMPLCKSIYGMRKYKWAWLTHAPIHPQELWGRINIHGHLHSAVIDDPRYVCVSAEHLDYSPVNIEDIFAACRKKGIIGPEKNPAVSRICD